MDYYERQEKVERWILWAICIAFGVLFLCKYAMAAECTVTLSWDGKDSAGNMEQSLPVTFEVQDADTLDVLTSAQVNGPVTDYAVPSFGYQAPDNQEITLRIQARAKDSKGNTSPPSAVVSAVIKGADTLGPLAPQITITVRGNK